MMTKTIRHAQSSALPAIAAALALSSTSVWAQEVPASTTDQPTSSAPATTPVESVPDTSATAAPAPVEVMSTETVAPEPAAAPEGKRTTTARASTQRATAPKRARSTAPAAAAAAPVAAAAAAAAPAPTQPAPQPVATAPELASAPAPAIAEAPAATMPGVDEETLMLGGGALALLALGGAAVAMRRRRRRDVDVMADEYAVHEEVVHEPAPEPAPMAVTPRHDPAESWTPAIAAAPAMASTNHHMDRSQGETWVERAHRGPTPDNPSLSLRKRLKRAAFFDARERQVAAGRAEPVATDAGLPDNVVAPATTREREVEFA